MDKGKTSVSQELPQATVELMGEDGFKIQLEKLRANSHYDQADVILDEKGQGCISNPGGPTC